MSSQVVNDALADRRQSTVYIAFWLHLRSDSKDIGRNVYIGIRGFNIYRTQPTQSAPLPDTKVHRRNPWHEQVWSSVSEQSGCCNIASKLRSHKHTCKLFIFFIVIGVWVGVWSRRAVP